MRAVNLFFDVIFSRAMNSTQSARRQFYSETLFFPTMSSGDLQALISKWMKKRANTADSGTSGHFAGALYHDDAPGDFGPQFAYASWRWFRDAFRYLVPDKTVRERKVGP